MAIASGAPNPTSSTAITWRRSHKYSVELRARGGQSAPQRGVRTSSTPDRLLERRDHLVGTEAVSRGDRAPRIRSPSTCSIRDRSRARRSLANRSTRRSRCRPTSSWQSCWRCRRRSIQKRPWSLRVVGLDQRHERLERGGLLRRRRGRGRRRGPSTTICAPAAGSAMRVLPAAQRRPEEAPTVSRASSSASVSSLTTKASA